MMAASLARSVAAFLSRRCPWADPRNADGRRSAAETGKKENNNSLRQIWIKSLKLAGDLCDCPQKEKRFPEKGEKEEDEMLLAMT